MTLERFPGDRSSGSVFGLRLVLRWTMVAALVTALTPALAHAQGDEDDEDEGPAASQPAAPTAPAAPSPSAGSGESPANRSPARVPMGGAPAEVAPEVHPAPRPATVEATVPGYLEGRAESTSPNELIHTVERKVYSASGKGEVTLYPAAIQLNGKFTSVDGAALAVSYALQENFALQVLGLYDYVAGETGLNENLLDLHARPQAADALALQGGAMAGFEVAPIYGKFSFYDGTLAQFRFVLNAGAGIGKTNVQLTPGPTVQNPSNPPADFGDAGWRFLGDLGVGFRVLLGERVALRLEVRDLIYTARVDHINGCTLQDVRDLSQSGQTTDSGCNAPAFMNSPNSATQLTIAQDLLSDVSSDVLNNLLFFGGVSVLF
ncbi:MAG: outer membrane beta-barrel domain-containing protein [Deltaproteobacteria bacterium]